MHTAKRQALERLVCPLPAGVDIEPIWSNWQALQPPYDVKRRSPPVPVWARRNFDDLGEDAWNAVKQAMAALPPHRKMCLYVHLPFCAEKCTFCDCYSMRLKHNYQKQVALYTAALEQEIKLWSLVPGLSARPISTVHFGGGTPLFIGSQAFRQLVGAITTHLNIGPAVEWALETTSSALDEQTIDMLDQLSFTRIHIGVQSLSDPVRTLLKRSESAAQVLQKIKLSASQNRVVSVDLIYGLPQQTLASFIADVRILSEAGVDGFSLYPLQISSRNRGVLQLYGDQKKDLLHEYFMLQAAEQVLAGLGFRKTLFNHYARQKDTNLYFNFPERDEDCLALGTIADGMMGRYHYRHPEYRQYLDRVNENFPGLQGGMERSAPEERVHPLEVMILSSKLQKNTFEAVLGLPRTSELFAMWLESALISPTDTEHFSLTANGSWFAGAMLNQLICEPANV
jgi:oxygen-independent coproporphyrinogen-3 oxidase